MPTSPHRRSLRSTLHRRAFLAGAATVGVGAVGGAAALRLLPDRDTSSPTHRTTPDLPDLDPGDLQLLTGDASHPGRVTVATADGRALMHVDGFRLTSGATTRGATVTAPDAASVHVDFEVPAEGYTCAVTWRVSGGTVTGDWEFTVPDGGVLDDGRMIRTLVDADPVVSVPATRWACDPRGGVPYLERVTEHLFADWPVEDARIRGVLTVPDCRDSIDTSVHVPAGAGDDGVYRTTVVFRADATSAEARALVDDRRLLLAGGVLGHPDLPSPQTDVAGPSVYNVLTDPGTQEFTVGVAGDPGSYDVTVLARDYDGTEIHRGDVTVGISADARHGDAVVDIDLPDGRNWYCIDVTCGDVFARTTAAVWPEHDFGPAEESVIGLGGFSTLAETNQEAGLETVDDERDLWSRLGVRHLRNPWLTADEAGDLGIRTAILPSGQPGQFDDPDGQSFDDWTDDALTRGDDAGVEHYELLNEWNAQSSGNAAATTDVATEYTDKWLVPFRAAMDRDGSDAALLAVSMAGWDAGFLDTLRDRGGWDLVDGIAEHAGRGNYTADYDGATWNFLGQTRRARAYLDGHPGPDQLWLTEAYACTLPNSWWNDPPRVAADATFLSLLLAEACGVAGVHWYQLTDGVWHDKYGVDPTDPEYHYGLFHVDRSPKPSAVAFAWAAEVLDGASFLGWVENTHPDLRGLRFSRDGDEFRVLWSRQDGYVTTATRVGTEFHAFPEPWESTDGATLEVTVPDGVECRDVLGRPVEVAGDSVAGHTVRVGGSPVVVSGAGGAEWPAEVTGEPSVDLTGVIVRRDGTAVVVEGANLTYGDLTFRVLGRQVDGELTEPEVTVPRGAFSERVELGAAMPDGEAGPTASATGVNPGNPPQVRVLAEKKLKVIPEASEQQVWRAEYYRSV